MPMLHPVKYIRDSDRPAPVFVHIDVSRVAAEWLRLGSVGQPNWPDLSKDIARTRIVWMGVTTEMALDTPDRVQRGLYRTLYPRWGPRDVVTREENATLMGGQVVLHEVRVHPAVISVVSRQRNLERAERVFIGLPGDVIGSPTMWRAMSTSG